jgi:signal transduction histidine kinase
VRARVILRLNMKLRSYLIVIVASTMVPMLIIISILIGVHYRELRANQLQEYVSTARALSLAVDRNFETAMAVLKSLALSPYLSAGKLDEFHREAQRLVKAHQGGEAIVLVQSNGQQVVNSRTPFGSPLPRGRTGFASRIIQTKSAAVSNLITGSVVQRPQLVVGIPVIIDGATKFALTMALSPGFLQKLLEEQRIPSDSVATIIDANQIIVARTRDVGKYLGQKASPTLAAKSTEMAEGWWLGQPHDSAPTYSAHSRSGISGWTVAIAVPRTKVDGALWHASEIIVAIVALSLLAAIGLALVFGRRVVAAIDSLCVAAKDFATGATFAINPLHIDELDHLRRTIENAAAQRALILDANKELEAFSYSVSHDLRAPLRAIDAFSRIVVEEHGANLPGDGQRYLGLVRENTQKMGQLIDDLLVFSRMAGQKRNKQRVKIAEMIREAVAQQQSEQNGRRLEINIGELAECEADPALLKQVWTNLLSNALKFTRARDVARIEIGCLNQDDEVVYFVKDNGVGFDMRYAHKLFGVFQRLHRAEDYEGTGVGLAIVQRVVQRHGGRVWAESELDKGTTVYFTLEGNDNHE